MTSAASEPVKQDVRTPTPQWTATTTGNETPPAMAAAQSIEQHSAVVFAFVISFSVLVAAIVGFGKKKE
jgi:hypothetical protein